MNNAVALPSGRASFPSLATTPRPWLCLVMAATLSALLGCTSSGSSTAAPASLGASAANTVTVYQGEGYTAILWEASSNPTTFLGFFDELGDGFVGSYIINEDTNTLTSNGGQVTDATGKQTSGETFVGYLVNGGLQVTLNPLDPGFSFPNLVPASMPFSNVQDWRTNPNVTTPDVPGGYFQFGANINSLAGSTRAPHSFIQGGLTSLGNCTNINFTDTELNSGDLELQGTYGGIIVDNQSVSPNQAYMIWGKNHEAINGIPVRYVSTMYQYTP